MDARESRGPTILVVDDERGSRESLRVILSAHYEVRVAENAAQAFEALSDPQIALMTVE